MKAVITGMNGAVAPVVGHHFKHSDIWHIVETKQPVWNSRLLDDRIDVSPISEKI